MYSKIESKFWQDEKIRTLSPNARYIFLYLLTSPHRNMLGLYFLPDLYAAFDVGLSPEQFKEGFQELLRKGLVNYDETNHVVFIKNFLKHNPLENPNQVKKAIKKLQEIPRTPLLKDLYEYIKNELKPHKPHYNALLEELRKLLGEQFVEQFNKQFDEGYGKPVTVTETEAETETVTVAETEKVNEQFQQQLQQLYAIFENNIHPPTSIEVQKITDWLEDVEADVIVLAIEEAVKANKRTLKYIEAILRNWIGHGLKTKAAVEAYLRDWECKKTDQNKEEPFVIPESVLEKRKRLDEEARQPLNIPPEKKEEILKVVKGLVQQS
ncbi:DnaD and phage-associated domain [Thermoanaerobacter sp. YS13]|uniref:DnaD domain-containing protein n=1 Tax=Thermoanaerobacter sp. YS13 TaxID=1511746 RepID=UPI000574E2F5|nr:DnaD domain protein [Thermoanaerobacter sp. YS13]KHO63382.1 DnaD and phage-associated domain [Thermoanaerobacter sp. YS13]